MSALKGSATGPQGYCPVKGERDVTDLGGLSQDDMTLLDGQHSDFNRRRMLTNWFGSHGGRYAWDLWCKDRGRV